MSGLHHLTLTVSDLDVSLEWYHRVLGFTEVLRSDDGGLHRALMSRPDCVPISFVAHGDSAIDGGFDERRVGLDHVGLAVADHATLLQWLAVLDAHGVTRSEPVHGVFGWALNFRDPDNIALEFYTRD